MLNGEGYTVIGVIPSGQEYPGEAELWVPANFDLSYQENPWFRDLRVIGRLKPGITLAEGAANMQAIASQLERDYPQNKAWGTRLVPLQEQVIGDIRPCHAGPLACRTQAVPVHSADERCRARFLPVVGSTMRVTNYVWPGKPGPGITFKGCPLYLEEVTGGPKLDRIGRRKHQKVSLSGIVGYFAGCRPSRDDVEGVPEYFYIQVQQLTVFDRRVKRVKHARRAVSNSDPGCDMLRSYGQNRT